MLHRLALRRAGCAGRVVVVALTIGVGLIAMHSAMPSPQHSHSPTPGHALIADHDADSDAGPCEACGSHAAVTMACAVLLLAVAGGLAARVVRRLLERALLVLTSSTAALGGWRVAVGRLARAPDLHVLQVMRC